MHCHCTSECNRWAQLPDQRSFCLLCNAHEREYSCANKQPSKVVLVVRVHFPKVSGRDHLLRTSSAPPLHPTTICLVHRVLPRDLPALGSLCVFPNNEMHLKCDPVWSNTRCVEQAKAFIFHSDAKVQF